MSVRKHRDLISSEQARRRGPWLIKRETCVLGIGSDSFKRLKWGRIATLAASRANVRKWRDVAVCEMRRLDPKESVSGTNVASGRLAPAAGVETMSYADRSQRLSIDWVGYEFTALVADKFDVAGDNRLATARIGVDRPEPHSAVGKPASSIRALRSPLTSLPQRIARLSVSPERAPDRAKSRLPGRYRFRSTALRPP